MLRELLLVI